MNDFLKNFMNEYDPSSFGFLMFAIADIDVKSIVDLHETFYADEKVGLHQTGDISYYISNDKAKVDYFNMVQEKSCVILLNLLSEDSGRILKSLEKDQTEFKHTLNKFLVNNILEIPEHAGELIIKKVNLGTCEFDYSWKEADLPSNSLLSYSYKTLASFTINTRDSYKHKKMDVIRGHFIQCSYCQKVSFRKKIRQVSSTITSSKNVFCTNTKCKNLFNSRKRNLNGEQAMYMDKFHYEPPKKTEEPS